MSEKTRLEDNLHRYEAMAKALDDIVDLVEMAETENDEVIIAEAYHELQQLKEDAKRGELEALLSGEVDANDAFLEVHAGSGGTEAQDWAEMLVRMYSRWAERHGYKVTTLDYLDGEEAGLKSYVHYIWNKSTRKAIYVPDKDMDDFIRVASAEKEDIVYIPDVSNKLREGQKVRVLGGPFVGIEGTVVRLRRSQRVMVELKGMLAVATSYIPKDLLMTI